ncbi:alpha-galactosidase [Mucilaginibacter gynuensis]|uniref:Alpha-galactosidase n=1 Tax=Mucilaginibacter gynuensis TaxID=1302236 RepID=A0ABP8FME5_9SPHI
MLTANTATALPVPAIYTSAEQQVKIPYGKSGFITYDLTKGLLNVTNNGESVFTNIFSSVKLNNATITSKAYTVRKYSKTTATTGFGKGIKHVITLTGKDVPQMEQVFYTYPGYKYFFMEVSVKGTNLQTNDLVPFEGNFKNITGDTRSLFMPFDNDTFISYDARPFKKPTDVTSAEAGVVYDNTARNGLVVGSVEHSIWKTGVTTVAFPDKANFIQVQAGYSAEAVTRDKIPHGMVKGNTVKSPLIFVGYFADWRTGLETFGKANRIAEPPVVFNWTKPTPVGWNSWGVMQEHLNYEKVTKVADFFADSLKNFRSGNTAYIDMDSYWDNMTRGGLNGDFSKLKEFADYCKAKGLEPGVYWAPFTDWGWGGGPDRKVDGGDYTFGEVWTKVGDKYHDIDGARAMDPTHPGTKQRIALVIKKLKDCGFKMIKIDFLGHASAESTHFYDTTVTTGMQAYRKGMEYLINQLGNQMLIYAAISPNLATGRYVHTRRIACDAFKTIKDTQYTLNSVTYGWWQTYLYNYVDADHIVLSTEQEGANRARLLSGIITGTFITGDDFSAYGQWSARAKAFYQNPELLKVVANGKSFKPVDGNTDKGASEVFTRKIGNSYYVAVFNYGNEPKSFKLDAARIGLPVLKTYTATEVIQNNKATFTNAAINIELKQADAALYKFDIK